MNHDLQKARQLLDEHNSTCVLCKDDVTHTSTHRGVAPLLNWLDSGTDLRGFSAADRVVGKATAYLYCLLGVSCVFARVMSRPAIEVFAAYGIPASWETLVDAIENRQKNGPCPMEHATRNSTSPEEALNAVRQALLQLQQKA